MNKVNINQECLSHILTGNCMMKDLCKMEHPKVKAAKKSKLKFKKDKVFKPVPSTSRKSTKCKCCYDNPNNCKGSPICAQINMCYCVSKNEIEQQMLMSNQPGVISCDCCKGDFYNCPEMLCQQLGVCQCQMRNELENGVEDDANFFIEEYSNCRCCKGFVFNCNGMECPKPCKCFS